MTILESYCQFDTDIFLSVMLNLIKNPNLTSTCLFRADILFDSESDYDSTKHGDSLEHLKPEHRPILHSLPGLDLSRTIVRKLVPRNPQLDASLVQTCQFYNQRDVYKERNVVLYIPHVQHMKDIPFYHPSVRKLAFEHNWHISASKEPSLDSAPASFSISYCFFPDTSLTTKLERTALRLVQTIHKHGQGQVYGYKKRVHLDRIIPQKRYQDTYTRLKAQYGKHISEKWVEGTDPSKHVFEDIGIAAFLIELWRGMYRDTAEEASDEHDAKPPFPGFVDIGCGNGLLVYILLEEGYEGEGFDARERKTWSIFPDSVQQRLRQNILVPVIFNTDAGKEERDLEHNGFFPQGTFIISNHADELTAWTPLFAYLNNSAFIAIPCCSHDLSGARFRAPISTKSSKEALIRLPQQSPADSEEKCVEPDARMKQAAETGSLKRTEAQKNMPSAYSSLCSYVASLASDLGFVAEKDVLRIPSTRNHCIIGRRRQGGCGDCDEDRIKVVVDLVEREVGKSVETIGAEWTSHAQKLAKKPGSGH